MTLDTEEFSRWMKSAELTLKSAQHDLEVGDYNWACFKAHQAAEKALKALLHGVGRPTIGHALPKLLEKITQLNIQVPDNVREAVIRLNKFYIATRYPDAWSEGVPEEYYSEKEAIEALNYAKLVIDWVKSTWKRLLGRES